MIEIDKNKVHRPFIVRPMSLKDVNDIACGVLTPDNKVFKVGDSEYLEVCYSFTLKLPNQ